MSFSEAAKDDRYGDLRFFKENPVGKILTGTGLDPAGTKLARTGEEIRLYADAYMLCHWRAIERLVHNVKKLDMAEAALQTFGDDVRPAVELLPVTDKGDLDIKQHGLTLREISKTDLTYFDKIFAGRQKALNWLLGYEADWDNVTTDT